MQEWSNRAFNKRGKAAAGCPQGSRVQAVSKLSRRLLAISPSPRVAGLASSASQGHRQASLRPALGIIMFRHSTFSTPDAVVQSSRSCSPRVARGESMSSTKGAVNMDWPDYMKPWGRRLLRLKSPPLLECLKTDWQNISARASSTCRPSPRLRQ